MWFWEGVCRVHQAAKGVHDTKTIKNPCSEHLSLSMILLLLRTIGIFKMFREKKIQEPKKDINLEGRFSP